MRAIESARSENARNFSRLFNESEYTKLRGGQYFFDCSELLSTRGGCNRPFTMQFIIFQYFAGFFALFSLNPREVCPHLLWREHAPHLGNEPRQLSCEFRMFGGSTGKIQQLFSDHVIKCRFDLPTNDSALFSFRFCAVHPK